MYQLTPGLADFFVNRAVRVQTSTSVKETWQRRHGYREAVRESYLNSRKSCGREYSHYRV